MYDTIGSLRDKLNKLDFNDPLNWGIIFDLYLRLSTGCRLISKYLPDERFSNKSDVRMKYYKKADEYEKLYVIYRDKWRNNKIPS